MESKRCYSICDEKVKSLKEAILKRDIEWDLSFTFIELKVKNVYPSSVARLSSPNTIYNPIQTPRPPESTFALKKGKKMK